MATALGPTWHSRRGITSIGIGFDQPLDPRSAKRRRQYDVLADVMRRVKGHDVMDRKALRIARASYNGSQRRVRIFLAKPYKTILHLMIYIGLVDANGAVTTESYSWVVR
jgi:hypothetical protein